MIFIDRINRDNPTAADRRDREHEPMRRRRHPRRRGGRTGGQIDFDNWPRKERDVPGVLSERERQGPP